MLKQYKNILKPGTSGTCPLSMPRLYAIWEKSIRKHNVLQGSLISPEQTCAVFQNTYKAIVVSGYWENAIPANSPAGKANKGLSWPVVRLNKQETA